jgi:RHS repeat-associated protein
LDENNAPVLSFAWGTDISGTMQGAGGVGGLLSVTVHSGANAGTYFYCYDGNGNVVALVNAADGTIAARYECGPFGELLRATGPMAKVNPFRFSTKYQDDETGLLYYGYRYYDPSTGRWLSKDPNREPGHELLRGTRLKRGRFISDAERREPNLYGFVVNNPVGFFDPYGRELYRYCPTCLQPMSPFEQHKCPGPHPPDPCLQAMANAKNALGSLSNDKRAHCRYSCEIAKACGKRVCKCLGWVKESKDLIWGINEWVCSWVLPKAAEEWLHDTFQGGTLEESAEDFVANDWGLDVAAAGGDCVKECERRYGPEPEP